MAEDMIVSVIRCYHTQEPTLTRHGIIAEGLTVGRHDDTRVGEFSFYFLF